MIDQPYSVLATPELLSSAITIRVTFRQIGKSKPEVITAVANSEESVDTIVRKIVKEFTVSLIKRFYDSQQHRFMAHQTEWRLALISQIKDNVKQFERMYWIDVISDLIGPAIKQLATTNESSQFYKYDQDVLGYLRSVVSFHKNKVSN